jgi:starch synthase
VNDATGFKFEDLSPEALAGKAAWAVSLYRSRPEKFREMQLRAMQKPMGRSHASRQYEALYRLALARRKGG